MVRKYKKAFTLIELMTVIFIIGIISAIAIAVFGSTRSKAKLAAGQSLDASTYRAVGDQLIGEWLFDEGSGTVAKDTTGNHNGNIVGATWTTGISGSALSFVPGNYVSLGSDPSLNPPIFTITAWVKPGDFSGNYNYIYSNTRDCCGVYNGIDFYIGGNTPGGIIWNGGETYMPANIKISNDPVWTFVTLSYSGSTLALYVNGQLVKSTASALGIGSPASWPNYIGAMGAGPSLYGMNGAIDQVRLYGSAITAMDIHRLYAKEKSAYLAEK